MSFYRRYTSDITFLVLAFLFVVLAVVGAVNGYTSVPFWDMWRGYLDFYVKASSGDWFAWWEQHNEHRIVLAKLLFWIDLAYFKGAGWLLVFTNYLLVSLVCVVFSLIWHERSKGEFNFVIFFLIAWLFSWYQEENLTWGFQSQFILAQLLPLVAFYFLHKSVSSEKHDLIYFSVAMLAGVLSIGSMANGVLALPLMTLFCFLVRCSWRRSFFALILSFVCICLFFNGYVFPNKNGTLGQALAESPIELFHYILIYVGGPFYYLSGGGSIGLMISKVAGVVLISSSAVFFWKSLNKSKQSTLQLAMLFFILYVGGSAVGTAGGRLLLGVEQALSSRYITPALMAWAALFIVAAPPLLSRFRRVVTLVMLCVLLAMLPHQLKARYSKHHILFERDVAALAIELGVKDFEQFSTVHSHVDLALPLAKAPVEKNFSIFGLPPLADMRERIGQTSGIQKYPIGECLGNLDKVQVIPEDSRFVRIQGWMFDPLAQQQPEILKIIDGEDRVVGVVLSGQSRPDVAHAVDEKANSSGFKGYLLSGSQGLSITFYEEGMQCKMTRIAPVNPNDPN